MYLFVVLILSAFLPNFYCLENGLARTPPMGFMSWQRFRCLTDCKLYPDQCISQNLFKRISDRLASDGYLDAGYEYVIIDDCWMAESRDQDGRLQPNADRFPDGIRPLADYIHNLGLKFGIYLDYGTKTCAGYPGSRDSLELDANTLADWTVDYLKMDGCNVEIENMEQGYANMSRFLNATGRPVSFSCSFPAYKDDANLTAAVEFCNLWRNYNDIDDSYNSLVTIANWFGDNADRLNCYGGPGHWNDPDMLLIGNYGLSYDQSVSQMTIWSILAAPLLISADLDAIKPEFKEILLNREAIAINQDSLGKPGRRQLTAVSETINIWLRQLSNEDVEKASYALGFVSYRTDGYIYRYNTTLQSCGILQEGTPDTTTAKYTITDIFEPQSKINGKVVSIFEDIVVNVKPSGAVLLRLDLV